MGCSETKEGSTAEPARKQGTQGVGDARGQKQLEPENNTTWNPNNDTTMRSSQNNPFDTSIQNKKKQTEKDEYLLEQQLYM